jgi:hypothetical protein
LSDFNDISYVGRLWCPELIPDIEKFLPVAIFKMAAKIQHSSISKVAFDYTTTIVTRYDYNLTIMKSPKPATDNRFKK